MGFVRVGVCVLFGAGIVAFEPTTARAGDVAAECAEIDRSRRASCRVERSLDGDWVMTTRLVVGSGAKQGLASLEREFCEGLRARGRSGRVIRWNALPGSADQGAKMERRCDTPAVSSPPPARLPTRGGAIRRY